MQRDRNKTKTLTGNKDSYACFPRLPKNSSMACGSNVLMSKMGFFRLRLSSTKFYSREKYTKCILKYPYVFEKNIFL